MWNYYSYSELYHHGVRGQKWGVRNGPPYPIENTTMAKGTRLNSVSTLSDSESYRFASSLQEKRIGSKGGAMYTYNPNDEWDSKVYKGPFSIGRMISTGHYMYEHSYETVKDLKMPTSKQRQKAFEDLYNNKTAHDSVVEDLKNVQYASHVNRKVVSDEEYKQINSFNAENLKTKNDYKNAYRAYGEALTAPDHFKSTQAYMKYMSTKYDAMVDDHNVNVYNRAHDPVIIFKVDTALKTVGEARVVSYDEMTSNTDYVSDELKKHGEQMAL